MPVEVLTIEPKLLMMIREVLLLPPESAHMSSDRSFFMSLEEFAGGYIILANGKKT